MKFDLHLHTVYSAETKWPFESIIKPLDLVKTTIKRNMDGIAVTDHDTLKGVSECLKIVNQRKLDLKIIAGIEITSEKGHILGLGIEEWDGSKKRSAEETIDVIGESGGVAVAAHPFASNPFRKSVGDDLGKFDFDGIETLNYRTSKKANQIASKVAKKLDIGVTAGSDAHIISDIGKVWTVCDGEDIIKAVRMQNTKVFGSEMSDFKRYTYQLHKILELSKISLPSV